MVVLLEKVKKIAIQIKKFILTVDILISRGRNDSQGQNKDRYKAQAPAQSGTPMNCCVLGGITHF